MADEIGVVLVDLDHAAVGAEVAAANAFLDDALAGFVLGDHVAQALAFGRGILGMGVVVVKARAVGQDEVALDFLETQFPVLVLDEIFRLVKVLHQFLDAEPAQVLVRVFEVVVPLHRGILGGRLDLGVTAHERDRFGHDVDRFLPVDGDPVFGFDSQGSLHKATGRQPGASLCRRLRRRR